VFVDNALLNLDRPEGLFLQLDGLIGPGRPEPMRVMSTSRVFAAAPSLIDRLHVDVWQRDKRPFGSLLQADLSSFRRRPAIGPEDIDQIEEALVPAMPHQVTWPHPPLDAARYHTRVELDRTYRSIQR